MPLHPKFPNTPVLFGGINGVWFDGLMNFQPIRTNTIITPTFRNTITEFTEADSRIHTIRRVETSTTMATAGRFTMPRTTVPSGSATGDQGEAIRLEGSS